MESAQNMICKTQCNKVKVVGVSVRAFSTNTHVKKVKYEELLF